MKNIIELEEESPNNWQAKYKGRREIYTVKIILNGERTVGFFCSCSSSYYPCEHIISTREAIRERMNQNKERIKEIENQAKKPDEVAEKEVVEKEITEKEVIEKIETTETNETMEENTEVELTTLLENVPAEEPQDTEKVTEKEKTIDELNQWREKALKCAEQDQYEEAASISKTLIEATAKEMENASDEMLETLSENYLSVPFAIFNEVILHPQTDIDEWFGYCQSEKAKPIYRGTDIYDRLNELSIQLAAAADPEAFLAMQNQLSMEMQDKCSLEALHILKNKRDYYLQNDQAKKAWELIEKTIQLEQFRGDLQKRTEEKTDAHDAQWERHLLDKAQEENDLLSAQKLSYEFIKDQFHENDYAIYKSTFAPEEWPDELEKLLQRYGRDHKTFSPSAADALAAENAAEQLMRYIEQHLSVERIQKYYPFFAGSFPDKTLELFRLAIDPYMDNNAGADSCSYAIDLLKKMEEIEGGKEYAAEIAREYIVRYKNRKTLVEGLQDAFQTTARRG